MSVEYYPATGEVVPPREMSPSVGALAAALCKAQIAFPRIPKTRTAKLGAYSYTYAALEDILEATRPALSENDLAVSQLLNGGSVRTLLLHESGEWLASDTRLPLDGATKAQDVGSAVTYMRRYALCSMLGIAPEDDDDGASAAPKPAAVPKAEPTASPTAGPGVATEKQVGMIRALLKKLAAADESFSAGEFAQVLKDEYRVDDAGGLSKAQASEVISALKEKETALEGQAA